MSIDSGLMTTAVAALLMWAVAFAVYMLCNKGLSHIARGQQFRRYMLASACAMVPAAVTGLDLLQPAVVMALIVAVAWMVTYPLLYHLTNRRSATGYDLQIDIAFGIYLFGTLTGLLAVLPSARVMWLPEFILIMVPLAHWVYFFVCKSCINVSGMKMLQETHYNEIIEFLRSYHPLKVAVVAAAIVAVGAGCMAMNVCFGFRSASAGWLCRSVAAAVTLFMAVYMFKPRHGLFVRTGLYYIYMTVKEYVESNSRYAADVQLRMDGLVAEPLRPAADRPSTVVLVIGESASRDFMSAFSDMPVDTTPWMRALKGDEDHCIIFPNAYSCDVQTVPTLEKALTECNQYDGGEFHKSCSIVDIAHKLGWRVHWYSNQGHLGAADTPITLVAETADVAKWTNQELNKVQYDESLLEFLDEVNPATNNLVVLHLKGSHFNFENRFPKAMRQWGKDGDDDDIVSYNNSIYYTDAILHRFFDYGRSRLNMQAMIYFSDHGCVPDRHRLPNFGGFGDTRIPLMVWLSDGYLERHPDRAAALRANSGRYWTNDLAYDLLCGVMDIRSNRFNEYNSLASDSYRYTRDMLFTMSGQIKISDDNRQ